VQRVRLGAQTREPQAKRTMSSCMYVNTGKGVMSTTATSEGCFEEDACEMSENWNMSRGCNIDSHFGFP